MSGQKITREVLSAIVGTNIRRFRVYAGLSQDQLAEKLGVSKNYVSMMENGVKFPSAQTIASLSNSLQVQPYELFFDYSKFSQEDFRSKLMDSFSANFSSAFSKALDELEIKL